ncbi:tetratricopeptide repeat protein [Parasulfuritortus cantonensis]|uniref:Tetratricopeptide repeat protein n=1 Tax=Parasulfuritortus cantonensis TaxID=2528202 RepID=A0A4R1BMB3_9PROT|nr:nuclear transport factor 2 family protein [Parasulfuritortus cantonensis]TCJ18545.1 tetratricopeptide repeat protein [Parasulfuritortus cantonensis]
MKITRFALLFCCLLPSFAFAAATLPEATQLFKQGQNARALEKVNGYLSGNPKDPQGRFLKGLILAELNRPQEAIQTFSELTDDYPELPEPYNNLAVLYASQGQYERAKTSLEKAIRTHPSYATAHENLGDIYAKMASVAYDKALQLDKGNTSAQMKLALVKEIFTPASIDKAPGKPAAAPARTAGLSQEPSVTRDTQPVPPPLPASKPAAAPAFDSAAVEKTVNDWAAAWSHRDAPGYLAFYADDFKLPRKMSRKDWEAQRTDRLTSPEYIKVEISNLSVKGDAKNVTVQFQQRYESNVLKGSYRKTLTLENQGGNWKITSER